MGSNGSRIRSDGSIPCGMISCGMISCGMRSGRITGSGAVSSSGLTMSSPLSDGPKAGGPGGLGCVPGADSARGGGGADRNSVIGGGLTVPVGLATPGDGCTSAGSVTTVSALALSVSVVPAAAGAACTDGVLASATSGEIPAAAAPPDAASAAPVSAPDALGPAGSAAGGRLRCTAGGSPRLSGARSAGRAQAEVSLGASDGSPLNLRPPRP